MAPVPVCANGEDVGHTRRDFLCRAAGLAIVGTASGQIPPARAQSSEAATLHARSGTARLAPADYPETPIWGYEGSVPGPTIRVPQGTKVSRRFLNGLPQGSTVHWHGIRLENAMDGVPGFTQPLVEPEADFLYEFKVPDAGTFWYHPHERAWEQMARGLYGALVVEEPEPPFVDRDEVLLIDDWRLAQDASIHESFGALGNWSHGGRTGIWITVNGKAGWALETARNVRLRLRLVNVANARIFSIGSNGNAGPLRDTLLMERGETVAVGFVADNPGDWLLHCHTLEHSVSGMKTWFRVG